MKPLAVASLCWLALTACAQAGDAGAPRPAPPPSPGLVDSLAALITAESYCADTADLRRVATVVANRVADPRFPATYAAVIGDARQFPSTLRDDWGRVYCAAAREVARDVAAGARYLDADVLYFFRPDRTAAAGAWLRRLEAGTVVRGEHHHFASLDRG